MLILPTATCKETTRHDLNQHEIDDKEATIQNKQNSCIQVYNLVQKNRKTECASVDNDLKKQISVKDQSFTLRKKL